MSRAQYHATIAKFLAADDAAILGQLVQRSGFDIQATQRDAWIAQLAILRRALVTHPAGSILIEYDIPRLGKRIDVVALIGAVVFVIEFKVGAAAFTAQAIDQVYDYALDLKHFHEASHDALIAPILVATAAHPTAPQLAFTSHGDQLLQPICCTGDALDEVLNNVLRLTDPAPRSAERWIQSRYCPTPTIIEAATALYRGHEVEEISRSDAGAKNLRETTEAINTIIDQARTHRQKVICFVTGVPGAGKTLVGLNIATQHFNATRSLYSIFLSGNGPLVAILREALARDRVRQERNAGNRLSIGKARSEVQAFIQNVHHFRDDLLADASQPPVDHIAIFDEAQRAWTLDQTAKFMQQKKGRSGFTHSEPEFLISGLDRHPDWAVMICLVGGGQEINTGEAGIGEWIDSSLRAFPHWQLRLSSRLIDSEYAAGRVLERVRDLSNVAFCDALHLGVSMRSFRAENVSLLVKQLLDIDASAARETLQSVSCNYPLLCTRNLGAAKAWLRHQARGTERYGLVVSSQAQRLKPHAIDVRAPIDPVHWFLHGKDDVRSSYYLEDAATEFQIQGLELDWVGVVWDGDLRFNPTGWEHHEFRGDRWQRIRKSERQMYLKNAYRVLLTRARQGMIIVVPQGDPHDPTRSADFYNPTWNYLRQIGVPEL